MTQSSSKKSTQENDKLPPHDHKAEQGALGAVLLDADGAWVVMSQLVEILPFGAESFFDLRHRMIYEAMLTLFNDRKPIDAISVRSILATRSQIEAIGGIVYLAALPDQCAAQTMVEHYSTIVAGKAILREIIRIGLTAVEKVDGCEDYNELVAWLESRVLRLSASGAIRGNDSTADRIRTAIEVLDKIQHSDAPPDGLPTGLENLDEKTMGMMKGDYIVLAGRPSTGKSAFALNIFEFLAIEKQVSVGFISLEMTGAQLINRLIAVRAEVDSFRINRTKLTDIEVFRITNVVGKISKSPLYIRDQVKRDLNSIKSAARRLKIDHDIQILGIDFLQLIHMEDRRSRNGHEEIGFISGEIKQLAMELNIPVLMISQLNRDSDKTKKRAPRLSDLRGSGTIEENADVVWIMWRSEDEDGKAPGDIVPVRLLIEKQRNGPTGFIDLLFHRRYTKFKPKPKIDEADVQKTKFMMPGLGLTPEERDR